MQNKFNRGHTKMNTNQTIQTLATEGMLKAENLKNAINYIYNLSNEDMTISQEKQALGVYDASRLLAPMILEHAVDLYELLQQANKIVDELDNEPLMTSIATK